MQYGIYISNYALNGDPRAFVELAKEAEAANWDGFYIWDHVYPKGGASKKVTDPWITLAGIAAATDTIRIGTTVTPLPRRRPQKVARETVSLDRLSGGRFTLGVGLGHPPDTEFEFFGEDSKTSVRAEKLDEALEVITGLWTGKPFSFVGRHYRTKEVTFKPRPVQRPRIPIWCAGWWPLKRPFERAARYDGAFPLGLEGRLKPADYRDMIEFIKKHRKMKTHFDMVCMGRSSGNSKKDAWIGDYSDAGATWYVELIMSGKLQDVIAKIRRGPPSV